MARVHYNCDQSRSCLWLATLAAILTIFMPVNSRADLRTPTWYNNNSGGPASDWHYRVPVLVPAGTTVNATIKVDVDFAALLVQLGISGTIDPNSPRVVRSTNALATTQEYTASIYGGVTNATAGRGEVRFILEDAGPVTYYIYFDVAANGTKVASAQTPIDGNFEASATGTLSPKSWIGTRVTASADAQVRPAETVSVTANPTGNVVDGVNTRSTNGNPNSGLFSYLMGWRTPTTTPTASAGLVTLSRTITVPATSPGKLTFRWKPEGWDMSNNTAGYDYMTATLSAAGVTTATMIGPNASNTYANAPASANYQGNGNNQATATKSGYGQYNGFDCSTTGTHTNGMSVTCHSEPWFGISQDLSAFAGKTATLTFTVTQDNSDISWYLLDDVEWSVTTATLGTPEGFGINITTPTAGMAYTVGQNVKIFAQVDAKPTSVKLDIYNNTGTTVKSSGTLYNNGINGDITSNDTIWSNDGATLATFTLNGSNLPGSNWLVRVYALDSSTSSVGARAGLINIPGKPAAEVQADYYNVDEQTFTYNAAQLTLVKSQLLLNDPFNSTTNPKAIPGAEMRYDIMASNTGKDIADSNTTAIVDSIPANTMLYVGDFNGAGSGPVAFIDNSPTSGLSYSYTNLASTTDNIDFSKDNAVTWTYVPVPDANGYDALVTTVRVRPQGTFAAFASNPAPSCTVMFKVRIK